MEPTLMSLKILLPYKVFYETNNVKSIVAETSEGSYGFLPQRLDCVAALIPGILTYETEKKGVEYVAIDEGILIKFGTQVLISVRNAVGGTDLGKLHESVEKQFENLNEKEKSARLVMAKLESSFVQTLEKFHKE